MADLKILGPATIMEGVDERRIDAREVTLAWGEAARWKARLREESERAREELPIAQRLRRALELVQRQPGRGPSR